MQMRINQFFKIFLIFAVICCVFASMEEMSQNILSNNPYGRSLEADLLARLLMPSRLCLPKRNSELINSLLGLPKNLNNAGK